MHLVFAPSGRRVIPYPPTGIGILAAALRDESSAEVRTVDLEMRLASEHMRGRSSALYERRISVAEVLTPALTDDLAAYGTLLWQLVGAPDDDHVGISVMGFDQVASALLLARMALASNCRVIFGGQFFTQHSAEQVIRALEAFGSVTVTVGDGWQAIKDFASDAAPTQLANSWSLLADGSLACGPVVTAKSAPPQPSYDDVVWADYELFGATTYRNPVPIRRAHLYVWDKQCNFRCAFCRVASGSRAVLTPPGAAVESFAGLTRAGVTQANFMTNELNPSRTYLGRFLAAMENADADQATWFTYVRADHVTGEDFTRMHRLGARLARYGVESGSQPLLDRMRKDYQVPIVEDTLRAADDSGLWNHVNFLVGFPGETPDDLERTLAFVKRNASSIHSVRVNPFYLPPDTPIARSPQEFGIELTEFDSGWWNYRSADGRDTSPDAVVDSIERLTQACAEHGIGFAGTDPFFLLDMLSRHKDRDAAMATLRRDYAPFWTPAPTDVYKALIGGYDVSASWHDTALKRQDNYALTLTPSARALTCTD